MATATTTDVDQIPAGPELDALVYERLFGRKARENLERCSHLPAFSTDRTISATIDDRIAALGDRIQHAYSTLLAASVWGPYRGWQDWRDTWAVIRATPEQRCRAALKAASLP